MSILLKKALAPYLNAGSPDKQIIRTKIVEGAVRCYNINLASFPRQSALSLPAANAVDAKMLAALQPKIDIVAVEGLVPAFQEMTMNVPAGTLCLLDSLENVIAEWGTKAGTTGETQMCSANFDYVGFLDSGKIISLMQFVADHRFMKPGSSTLIAITVKAANRVWPAIKEAYARTLELKAKDVKNSDVMTASYLKAALLAACPKLEIKEVDVRTYRNDDKKCSYMHSIILEVTKPTDCPKYEVVTKSKQGTWHRNVFIPHAKRPKDAPAIRVRANDEQHIKLTDSAPVAKARAIMKLTTSANKAAVIAQAAELLSKSQIRVLRRAAAGEAYPSAGDKDYSAANAGLKAFRAGTPRGLVFGKALQKIRPLWTHH